MLDVDLPSGGAVVLAAACVVAFVGYLAAQHTRVCSLASPRALAALARSAMLRRVFSRRPPPGERLTAPDRGGGGGGARAEDPASGVDFARLSAQMRARAADETAAIASGHRAAAREERAAALNARTAHAAAARKAAADADALEVGAGGGDFEDVLLEEERRSREDAVASPFGADEPPLAELLTEQPLRMTCAPPAAARPRTRAGP